jgi:hypothetical protein
LVPPPTDSAVQINIWKNDFSGVWSHAFGKLTQVDNVFTTSGGPDGWIGLDKKNSPVQAGKGGWIFDTKNVAVESFKSGNASFGFRIKTDAKPATKELNPRIVFNYNISAPMYRMTKPGDTSELARRTGLRFRVDGQVKLDYVAGKDIMGAFEYDLDWDREAMLSWEFVVPEYDPKSVYFAHIDV